MIIYAERTARLKPARASVVCSATAIAQTRPWMSWYLNFTLWSPVLIKKIVKFENNGEILVDRFGFCKRGLCVDAAVTSAKE